MWDLIIKKEINRTIIDAKRQNLNPSIINKRLDDLVLQTKKNAPPGTKRLIKKNIFDVKKQFRL